MSKKKGKSGKAETQGGPGKIHLHPKANSNGFRERPEEAGRRSNIYKMVHEKGYSAQDIRTAFGEMAWYTLDELKEVHKDPEKPIIMRVVANQFFQALKKGDWNKIAPFIEHTIGKAVQPIEDKTIHVREG